MAFVGAFWLVFLTDSIGAALALYWLLSTTVIIAIQKSDILHTLGAKLVSVTCSYCLSYVIGQMAIWWMFT